MDSFGPGSSVWEDAAVVGARNTNTHKHTHINAITNVKICICKVLSSYLINECKFWWGTLLECRQKERWHVCDRFYKHNQILRTTSMMQRELHKSQHPMLCITKELPHLSWGKRKKKKKLKLIQIKMIICAENIMVSSAGWLIVVMQDRYPMIIGWILRNFLGRQ